MNRGMKEQKARFYEGYRYKPRHVQPARAPARPIIDLDDIEDEPSLRTVFIPAPASPGTAGSPRAVVRVTRHHQSAPRRVTTTPQTRQDPQLAPQAGKSVPRRRYHSLTYIGAPLLLMVTGFLIISTAMSWWKTWTDDMRYGRPRTYQTDAHVGHGDNITPSHFIAVNLHGRLLVTEIAGGDPTKSKIYVGPDIGDPDIPVTLEFRDVNGDKRVDMLLLVNKKANVFINDTIDNKPEFRPVKEGEMVNL